MPRTLSAEEYKELGKQYYVQKNYQKALDAFSEGISAGSGLDVQLYDYRAATYDKLDDTRAALADSRLMIKTNERDARGYLRAGQLLQKFEKGDQALLIYERGLRYVPITSPQYKLLRGAHDKLNHEMRPPKSVDPLTQLPIEIVEMIVGHLQFYELALCTRVSRQWRTFLHSLPKLWTKMDLYRPGSKRTVSPAFIRKCVKNSQGKMVYARLAGFNQIGTLTHLATVSKSLETLEFANCQFGPDSIIDSVMMARQLKTLIVHERIAVNVDQLQLIFKRRPQLQKLRVMNLKVVPRGYYQWSIGDLPNLRVLDLGSEMGGYTEILSIPDLLTRTKNLKELRLMFQLLHPVNWNPAPDVASDQMFAPLHQLAVLVLKGFQVYNTPLPLTLEILDCPGLRSFNPPMDHDWNGLPLVEHLHLRDFQGTVANVLQRLDAECGNEDRTVQLPPSMLKTFTLQPKGFAISKDELKQIMEHPRLQHLEELSLAGENGAEVDDQFMEYLGGVLPRLKKLELDSASITGVGIHDLVIKLNGTLQELNLTACDRISHDTLQWAVRKGIAVHVAAGRSLKSSSGRRQ